MFNHYFEIITHHIDYRMTILSTIILSILDDQPKIAFMVWSYAVAFVIAQFFAGELGCRTEFHQREVLATGLRGKVKWQLSLHA